MKAKTLSKVQTLAEKIKKPAKKLFKVDKSREKVRVKRKGG